MIGGASGDMLLGALLNAGLNLDRLTAGLRSMGVGGFSIRTDIVKRGVISATLVNVDLEGDGLRRRDWPEFRSAVERSKLPSSVRADCLQVFDNLAAAEEKVHGDSPDSRLHELGTVDTLVDVVGFVMGLHLMGVEQLYASAFPAGYGVKRSGHGPLPLPAPATLAVYAAANSPVHTGGAPWFYGEVVTPTGAALVATLADFDSIDLRIETVAYGAGSRDDPERPNVVGIWLGEVKSATRTGNLSILETNIDDMSGEIIGYVSGRLFDIGALDVWITPIQMKKNRPGITLSALVENRYVSSATELVLRETSTLGVRVRRVDRYEAQREIVEVDTSLGRVAVKVKSRKGSVFQVSAEYEDCRLIADTIGLPLAEVMRRVEAEAHAELSPGYSEN